MALTWVVALGVFLVVDAAAAGFVLWARTWSVSDAAAYAVRWRKAVAANTGKSFFVEMTDAGACEHLRTQAARLEIGMWVLAAACLVQAALARTGDLKPGGGAAAGLFLFAIGLGAFGVLSAVSAHIARRLLGRAASLAGNES